MPLPLLVAAAVGCCGVTGVVRSADGAPLRAHVHAVGSATADADADARGNFRFTAPPGAYRVTIVAAGYAVAQTDVVVHEDERLDVTLEPLGSGRLREIGRVVVDGRLALPHSTVPTREITRLDLDANGFDRILDALATIPSLSMTRPDAGTASATAVVSLRGPDPSETRIALDGQPLNNANTGDLDLASFPSSVLAAIDISEGLGPEDTRGADTIGGEINLVSLRPTATPQRMLRLSAGSFGTTSAQINATGRVSRFGYALALGSAHSGGYVHDYPVTLQVPDGSGGTTDVATRIGSATSVSTSLVNLTYDFTPRSTLRVRALSVNSVRDEGAAQTAPVDPAVDAPGSAFVGSGPETSALSVRATLASLTVPLGAGTLSISSGLSSDATAVTRTLPDAGAFSPYDVSLVDRLATTSAEWSRAIGTATVAFGAQARSETLASADQFVQTLRETGTQVWVRAGADVGPRLRVAASVVSAHWSTFGTSTDGRLGLAYDDGHDGTLRFAVGTGFRAPLLSELYTLPVADLTPDQNCVGANGNRNEHAEHATEYELGYGKRFGTTTADVTLYRTNLRDPIEVFYPLGTACPLDAMGNPISTVVAQSFPVNVGNVVYQGGSLRLAHRFGALFASAEYGVNAAYPTTLPGVVAANPTSGSNLVVGQQFGSIPIQTFAFGLRYARNGVHGAANLTAKSANNELAQPHFATVSAAFGKTWKNVDLTLAGTNLTNAVSGRFTRLGLGTPYPTPFGLQPRDALVLDPASFRLILTLR
ncbi:MAG TPA: TonB-dependent receptor [Candidatus Elarobacter sp.]|nr:TonB-dependent receptor [Candidatus Elarobacter sp.]